MIKRLSILLSVFGWSVAPAAAADWPQFRGPDRNDVSKETGLLKSWPVGGPKLLWTFREAGCGYSSMAVVGHRLYAMGGEGDREYLYAIDLNKQKKAWRVDVGELHQHPSGDGPCSTPTVDGEFIYAVGSYGRLVCVKAMNGVVVWAKELTKELKDERNPYGFPESPLIDKDQVVVTPGGRLGAIAAFDKKNGRPKWRSVECIDQASCASMIAVDLGGVRQYVQATASHLVGVRASDGRLLWRYRIGAASYQVASPIICKDDCIWVTASGGGCLLKLRREGDAFEVGEIYRRGKLADHFGGVIRIREHLYGNFSTVWICQNFHTGKRVWSKRSEGAYDSASVTLADGCLYGCQFQTGKVQLIQATSAGFKEQASFQLPEKSKLRAALHSAALYTRPVVANGKLYLRDQELLFCYGVRNTGSQP